MIKRAIRITFGGMIVAVVLSTYSIFKYNPLVIGLENFWLGIRLTAMHRRGEL